MRGSGPDIILKDIEDEYVRENFARLDAFLQKFPLFRANFKFFEIEIPRAVTNWRVNHGLGFVPTDILVTQVSSGEVTWNWSLFTRDYLDITTTAACTIRAFIGAYREG